MATLVPEMAIPIHRNAVAGSQIDAAAEVLARSRIAQSAWAATSLRQRIAIIKQARHLIAAHCRDFAASVSATSLTHRNLADTLVAEVLPLAEACRFLERDAELILRPRKLGRRGRPLWLGGVEAEVHRVPLGTVLIIGAIELPPVLAWRAGTAGAGCRQCCGVETCRWWYECCSVP